jgi:hypothetical protein
MSVILIGSLHQRPRNPLLAVLLPFLFLEDLIRGWFTRTQTSIAKFTVPRLSKATQSKINSGIAMHYYMTGTSFTRIENPRLLKTFYFFIVLMSNCVLARSYQVNC